MIAKHYNELTTGHLGCDRILELLGQNYYLPNVRKYVETYITTCNVYARAKALHYKLFGLL